VLRTRYYRLAALSRNISPRLRVADDMTLAALKRLRAVVIAALRYRIVTDAAVVTDALPVAYRTGCDAQRRVACLPYRNAVRVLLTACSAIRRITVACNATRSPTACSSLPSRLYRLAIAAYSLTAFILPSHVIVLDQPSMT